MNEKNIHNRKPFNVQAFFKNENNLWRLRRKKQPRKGFCAVAWCRRRQRADGKSLLCHTCESREYRANHLVRYSYHHLKCHAKERRIAFALTFEQFEAFVLEHGYLAGKGRNRPSDLQIDRIDRRKGYLLDNIRVTTFEENNRKWFEQERHNIHDPNWKAPHQQ